MEDVDVALMVRDALIDFAGVDTSRLGIECHGGVVTLTGLAFGDDQRREAGKIASKIPGVRRVVNEIIVVAGSI